MKKEGLVLLKNNKAVTTSLIIAKELNRSHFSITKVIKENENSFKRFGLIQLQVEKRNDKNKIGRPENFYYLNEDQFIFLITLLRVKKKENDKVLEFKIKVTEAFSQMKDIISSLKLNYSSEEWQKLREESKQIRFQETDEIKRLTEYAKESGSENAETYYTHFSNLIWKHLFDVEIECKNKRNILNANQLQVVIQAENIIKKCIIDGIKEKIDYHDIYAKAKKNIEIFASLIEITKIPYYTQISMI